MRRFDPDTIQNGHIYSSIKEEEVFIYWVYLLCLLFSITNGNLTLLCFI